MTELKVKQQCELCNRSFLNLKQHQTKSHKKLQVRITENTLQVIENGNVIQTIEDRQNNYAIDGDDNDDGGFLGYEVDWGNDMLLLVIYDSKKVIVQRFIKDDIVPMYKHNIEFIFG